MAPRKHEVGGPEAELAKPEALLIIGAAFQGVTPIAGCGSSSEVEHHVANVRVEGSIPFSRSIPLPPVSKL